MHVIKSTALSPLGYGGSRLTTFRDPTKRRLNREWILQHVQPAAQAVSADGVPGARALLRGSWLPLRSAWRPLADGSMHARFTWTYYEISSSSWLSYEGHADSMLGDVSQRHRP